MLRSWFFQHVAQTSPSPMGLEISHAKGSRIFDVQGKSYLDFISGISVSNLGHGNPEVMDAIARQAQSYQHTLVYGEHIQAPQVELAREIAATLPAGLSQILFVNSGSEAFEAALKLVKRATNRYEAIGCQWAYHGSTHGALSFNGDEYYRRNFRPLLPGVRQIRFGEMEDLKWISCRTAGVFVETVQGEAGVKTASAEWFAALRKRCNEVGALLVLDEIQAGFGRTGTFWAFEQTGIEPDIVLMAKGMGAGMPLGALAASPELLRHFTENPVLGHISTFGGHPVSCAAALAGLRFLQRERWIDFIPQKVSRIRELLEPHRAVKEMRSAGFLMALELGSFEKVQTVIGYCLEHGLITDWFLHCNTALRMAPPLTISEAELEEAASILLGALDQLS